MTASSLLNSKGESSRAWSLVMSLVAHQIQCIAFMFLTHVFSSLSWSSPSKSCAFFDYSRVVTWCASLKAITTPAARSMVYPNSKHPNSQAKLKQFKCSRALRSMGNYSAEQTAEQKAGETSTGAPLKWPQQAW